MKDVIIYFKSMTSHKNMAHDPSFQRLCVHVNEKFGAHMHNATECVTAYERALVVIKDPKGKTLTNYSVFAYCLQINGEVTETHIFRETRDWDEKEVNTQLHGKKKPLELRVQVDDKDQTLMSSSLPGLTSPTVEEYCVSIGAFSIYLESRDAWVANLGDYKGKDFEVQDID